MAGPLHQDRRSQRERMLAGDLYDADDAELKEAGRRTMRLVERYNKTSVDEPEERLRILTELLGSVGEGVEIRPPLHCDYGGHIHMGAAGARSRFVSS